MDANTLVTEGGNIADVFDVISEERKTQLIEMGKAGLFYGRKKSKTHPKMKPFIYGQRNGVEIIDGNHTLTLLEKASAFLSSIVSQKGNLILVVGTHPAAKNAVETFARGHNFPHVTGRW